MGYRTSKTENFVTRHVKLITFLICIGVFLAAFLPIAMLERRELYDPDTDKRPRMTVADVIRFSEQEVITKSQIEAYASHKQTLDHEYSYIIEIEPHYRALIYVDKNTGTVVYFTVSNGETDQTADVMTQDMKAFFEQ